MRKILLFISLLLLFEQATFCQTEIKTFVRELLEKYPRAELADIYKSCFQDYFGPEHMLGSQETALQYINHEIEQINKQQIGDQAPIKQYYEPCGMEGNFVRVYLDVVLEGFLDAQVLAQAFFESAKNVDTKEVKSWQEVWNSLLVDIEAMDLNLENFDQQKDFIADLLAKGDYAISHSKTYHQTYHPHYRIIQKNIFQEVILPQLPTFP